MQNWERSEFDEQWKDAFTGAEVTPSASVWANVDRSLTLADNTEGKRRVVFYQRLAAACVLFALTAGGFGIYYWNQSEIRVAQINSGKTVSNKSQTKLPASKKGISPNGESTLVTDSLSDSRTSEHSKNTTEADRSRNLSMNKETISSMATKARSNSRNSTEVKVVPKPYAGEKNARLQTDAVAANDTITRHTPGKNTGLDLSAPVQKRASDVATATSTARGNTEWSESDKIISTNEEDPSRQDKTWLAASVNLPAPELLPVPEIQGEPGLTEIYHRLPYISPAFMNESKHQKFEYEKLWASVTAASGSYSESSGSSYNSYAAAQVYNVAALQSSTSGNPTYSNSNGASTVTVPTVGKSYSYGVLGGVRLAERWVLQTGVQYVNQSMGSAASPYSSYGGGSLISTNEFVSLPLQAGYLLINRRIGWQLNSGVSSDFFVRNTTGNQQVSVVQGAGTDSPYRSVNFAGLMSSEFSYKLGKNYRVSLVPGMRYSLNPALKSMTTGNAMTWDVGFRFRYIFK